MNVAIIGAGNMAQSHSFAYRNIPETKVVCVVDVSAENAGKIADAHGAAVYATIEEMQDKAQVDIADICAPSFLHASMTKQCLDRGLHVLCEKPIANNLADADEVLQAVEGHKEIYMTGQILRFWPEYTYLKRLTEEKTYGALKHVFFSRMMAAPRGAWYRDPERCGMAPYEVHIHDADYIHYLLGVPKGVSSFAVDDLPRFVSYIKSTFIYDDVLIDAEAGWSESSFPFTASFRATFEDAVLEYKDGALTVYPRDAEPQPVDLQLALPGGSAANAIYNEIRYFVDCIRNGKRPEVITPRDSREVLFVLSKQLESARTREVAWL